MNIITGKAKGVKLNVPINGTRPTMQRVKESIFSSLYSLIDFENIVVLDLYAGSGNLGLEAFSRGATSIDFIENDRNVIGVIKNNIEKVNAENTNIINLSVEKFLKNEPTKDYDLIFLDPPYNIDSEKVLKNISLIEDNHYIKPDGIIVLEVSTKLDFNIANFKNLSILKELKFGSTTVYLIEKY